jgi:hypothetical protein
MHQMCWPTIDAPASVPTPQAVEGDVLANPLLHFEGLFVEPTGVPPHRSYSHQI